MCRVEAMTYVWIMRSAIANQWSVAATRHILVQVSAEDPQSIDDVQR